jgi:STE24 endopeptidase
MRDLAQRVSPRPGLYTLVYSVLWVLVMFTLALPLGIYTDFIREHEYGLSEQPFGGWMGDQLKGLGVGLVLAPIAISGVYAAVRRAGARWWMWATGLVLVFNLFLTMITPVFIAPLFTVRAAAGGPIREAVHRCARQRDSDRARRVVRRLEADHAHRRECLQDFRHHAREPDDNLMKKTSLPEIKAILGTRWPLRAEPRAADHDLSHARVRHRWRCFISRWMRARALGQEAQARRSHRSGRCRWRWRSCRCSFSRNAGLNGVIRQAEDADAFGLMRREAMQLLMSAIRLSTYRKISPGPVERSSSTIRAATIACTAR